MKKITVTTASKSLSIDQDVWTAFLQAASLIVDTGDMYPHLEKNLGAEILDRVKQLKIDLDYQNQSS